MTVNPPVNRRFGHGTLRLMQGDITTARVNAIVNAANEQLLPGGGVCGAIHAAGGPSIAHECRTMAPISTGDAVATTAGTLHARRVIHAVAPIWQGGNQGSLNCLPLPIADPWRSRRRQSLHSIAFPSLGTGINGYPIELAAPIALRAAADHLLEGSSITESVFYLFSESDLVEYEERSMPSYEGESSPLCNCFPLRPLAYTRSRPTPLPRRNMRATVRIAASGNDERVMWHQRQ